MSQSSVVAIPLIQHASNFLAATSGVALGENCSLTVSVGHIAGLRPLLESLPNTTAGEVALYAPLSPTPGSEFPSPSPLVDVIMGSDSDLSVMLPAARILGTFSIPYELVIQGDITPPSNGLPLHNRTTFPTRCTGSAQVTLTGTPGHNLCPSSRQPSNTFA